MHPDLSTSSPNFVQIKPGYCVGRDGSTWSCVRWRRKGRVKYGQWRRLNPHVLESGHCTIELGRGHVRYVHHLVLEAFVGPCPDGLECRHLDGNPENNDLANLVWGTRSENYQDSVKHGTAFFEKFRGTKNPWPGALAKHKAGEKHHRAKLSDEQVAIIKATVDLTRRNGTASRLAKEWNVSQAIIRMIARGVRRTGTD